MIKKINIYDMDGTIVCSLHRYRTQTRADGKTVIDLRHWRENQHKANNDSLLPLAQQYQQDLLNSKIYTVIATARVLNEPDKFFINNILGKPNHIISRRGDTDQRGGAQLKIAGLRKLLNLRQFQKAEKHFFEDNADYLREVCAAIGAIPHFIESSQGH